MTWPGRQNYGTATRSSVTICTTRTSTRRPLTGRRVSASHAGGGAVTRGGDTPVGPPSRGLIRLLDERDLVHRVGGVRRPDPPRVGPHVFDAGTVRPVHRRVERAEARAVMRAA